MNSKCNKRSAFSLTEILVVIGIIVVIAGLIMPVFLSTRKSAKRVSCISNLHQFGLAAKLYESDFDDKLPHENPAKWYIAHLKIHLDPMRAYVSDPRIYQCPDNQYVRQTKIGGTDFTMRFVLDLAESSGSVGQRWRIVPDSNSVLTYCGNHLTNPNHAISDTQGGSITNGTFNALRYNGAVQKVPTERVKQHREDWGGFGAGIQAWSYEWLEFPEETFPPQMEILPQRDP